MEQDTINTSIIVNDKHVSNCEEKANHFNKFFASECKPIDIDSQIPNSVVFNTEVKFSKLHVFNDILIRIIKLCDDSLVKPLSIIFQNCINSGVFPDFSFLLEKIKHCPNSPKK